MFKRNSEILDPQGTGTQMYLHAGGAVSLNAPTKLWHINDRVHLDFLVVKHILNPGGTQHGVTYQAGTQENSKTDTPIVFFFYF